MDILNLTGLSNWLLLIVLAVVSFCQNMVFTLVSRSRNSADPNYHRWCAYLSNSVWFVCQLIVIKQVWTSLTTGNWLLLGGTFIVYSICTAEGSVTMMKILLKKEKGKRRVGARSD